MKKLILVGVIVTLGVFVGLFYWYEIRPSRIYRECDASTRDKVKDASDQYLAYRAFYSACLHKNGLKD